ncbi:hypothetical protein PI126_g2998 [Phytophthora idaei]|nr:hypothetical protein PI126_g2998 [Phytophthora idaei]
MWADLSARLKEKGLRVLAKPGDTRWGSLLACFQTILAAEGILFSFVLAHRFLKAKTKKQKKTRRVVYDLATSTSFVSRLEKAVSLLKPINSKSFEKNTTPVSDVYQVFTELPAELNVVNLTAAEHKTVKTLIKSRFDFIYGDAHGLAYLLDPRYGAYHRHVRELKASQPHHWKFLCERKIPVFDFWSAIYGLQGNEIGGVRRSAIGGKVDNVAGTCTVAGGSVRVSGGSLSASSGLAGDVALSGGVASIGAATGGVFISSGTGSLDSGASASGVAFSGPVMIGSGESADDASGVVTLSSGSSEAASSGDVSVQSGVAATVAGRVSVSGESSSSSTGGASGVGGDVTVSSGDSSSSTTGSSVFVRSGSGGTLSLVQGNSSAAGADVELVAGGVGSKDAAQKMRVVGSANSQGAGGFVSIYDGSSAASEGDTALLTAVVAT